MGRVEVVDKKCDKTVRFDAVEVGETFRFDDKIYLKYSRSCVGRDCAFSFKENLAVHFSSSAEVIPVDCKLVVEG